MSESGSFFLDNTSEAITLLDRGIEIWYLGTTWNLTIRVHSNSSSAVNITAFMTYDDLEFWLSGNLTFQVYPNETRSELYVSQVICDYTSDFNFKYSLVDVSKNASGTFEVQTTYRGYYVTIVTGCAWLDTISTSSLADTTPETCLTTSTIRPSTSKTTSAPSLITIDFLIILITLIPLVLLLRRGRID